MKTKNKLLDELASLSWRDINKMIKEGQITSAKKQLGKDAYRFIAKEENLETVVELAYTSLQKTDPKQVTIEQAVKIAEEMQKFARTIVEKMNEEEKVKAK